MIQDKRRSVTTFRKKYFWVCIVLFSFWGIIILMDFSAWSLQLSTSSTFWKVLFEVSRIACISCVSPFQPVLSVIALIYALCRKQTEFIKLIAWFTLLIYPLLAFFLMVGHVVALCGGV